MIAICKNTELHLEYGISIFINVCGIELMQSWDLVLRRLKNYFLGERLKAEWKDAKRRQESNGEIDTEE